MQSHEKKLRPIKFSSVQIIKTNKIRDAKLNLIGADTVGSSY